MALASWNNGRWAGLAFAVMLPLVRLFFNVEYWSVPWSLVETVVNAFIRIVVLSTFAVIIGRTSEQTRKLSKEIKMLEGFLPICSYCKKIRDEKDSWRLLEKYIMAHTDASFTHGICPECMRTHFGDLIKSRG